VPWQQIAKRTGARFRPVPVDGRGELQLDALDAIAKQGRVKAVANNLVSNVLGTINPVDKLAAWAHEQGAIMVVDAAQAAPHRRIDVQKLGCDFLALSSHKLCGPTGVGVLWGRAELLEQLPPFNFGGEMIRKVTVEETTFNDLPYKFEAGTPIAEAVGMGAAIDYLSEIGIEAIEEHEHTLAAYALEGLADVPGVHLFGPPAERRAGIVSFDLEGVHPHDVAQILDWEGVAIRAGHHCCQPLMARLGVAARTGRASTSTRSPRRSTASSRAYTRSRGHSERERVRSAAPFREDVGDEVHHRRALHRHQRSLLRRCLPGRLHPRVGAHPHLLETRAR
jgi:cysteine desulfurase/selenocysteine lyase